MTRAERLEVSLRLQTLPPFFLKMMKEHPNMCAEMAANELIVRKVKAAA